MANNDSSRENGFRSYAHYKRRMDEVSPSFCLAKWLQVTLDLGHGTNHSCHHPRRHAIPLEELDSNPMALHNTSHKMDCRRMMLAGQRPEECSFCWQVEDASNGSASDRILKSAADWSWPRLEEVRNRPVQQDINPSYLEVMFDNVCNFSCIYCNAETSSSIATEMDRFGPLRTSLEGIRGGDGWKNFSQGNGNPFVKAFWEWWPTLLSDLEVLRITGGEPLLISHTYKVMDSLLESPPIRPLTFAINSNLGVPPAKFSDFLGRTKSLAAQSYIHRFQVFTSVDTHGEQAEYIRWGLDYVELLKRAEQLLDEIPQVEVIFMVTLNLLSLPRLQLLLQDILGLKQRHGRRVKMDISHLVDPEYLSIKLIAPSSNFQFPGLLDMLKGHLRYMEGHQGEDYAFDPIEIEKLSRVIRWVEWTNLTDGNRVVLGCDFYLFIVDYDRRKHVRFEEIFPELVPFLEFWRRYYERKSETLRRIIDRPLMAAAVLQSLPAVIYGVELETFSYLISRIERWPFDKGRFFKVLDYAVRTMLVEVREKQNLLLGRYLALGPQHDLQLDDELMAFMAVEGHVQSVAQIFMEKTGDEEALNDYQEILRLSLFGLALITHRFPFLGPPAPHREILDRILKDCRGIPAEKFQLSRLLSKLDGEALEKWSR